MITKHCQHFTTCSKLFIKEMQVSKIHFHYISLLSVFRASTIYAISSACYYMLYTVKKRNTCLQNSFSLYIYIVCVSRSISFAFYFRFCTVYQRNTCLRYLFSLYIYIVCVTRKYSIFFIVCILLYFLYCY
jgi:hypothetical protein